MEAMITKQLKAEWLYVKAKITYRDRYQRFKASSTVRMRKDSIIWMNIKKLGIEVARIQITKDSIYIINRIDNEYSVKDLDYVKREFNIPAKLQTIQAFVLGNPVFFTPEEFKLESKGLLYHLFAMGQNIESHYWLNASDLSIHQMAFEDLKSRQKIDMSFEEYKQTPDKQNFSYFRNLELNSRQTGQMSIGLKITKVELNIPKDIRFEIPERYTQVD